MKKIIALIILLLSASIFIQAQSDSIKVFDKYYSEYIKKYYPNHDLKKDSIKIESYAEAEKFFEIAYTLETDSITKSEYYYYAAVVKFAQNNFSQSREFAYKSAEFNPKYGKPYILIAKLYGASAGSCGDNKFEKSAVYWAAVDKLEKAKTIDNTSNEEINELIKKYKSRFPGPSLETERIYDGDEYKIGCWINEVTTVRFYDNNN